MNLIKTNYFAMAGNCMGMCFPVNLHLAENNTVSFDHSLTRTAALTWPQFVVNFKFHLSCKTNTPQVVHIEQGTYIITFPVQFVPKETLNVELIKNSIEHILSIVNALQINTMCIPVFPDNEIFEQKINPILVEVFENDPRLNIIEHHQGW